MAGSMTKTDTIMTKPKLKTDKSADLMRQTQRVIPGGVNSPVRAFKAVGGVPRFVDFALGYELYDIDGNRYTDFCMSWGPLILGHADPDVVEAIKKQAELGVTYGACTNNEYELASFIIKHCPHVEKIRFVSSGTEATMSAMRLARGYTKRNLIVKFDGCYHGHSDSLLVNAGSGLATFGEPSSAGVTENAAADTVVLPLNNEDALNELFANRGNEIAAVIIEGVPANNGLLIQSSEFMQLIRALTQNAGSLMILDEVITGFRLGLKGAAGYYDITPDLVTYGKIIGGGLPVGAFGGRAEIMKLLSPDGPVYQAGTLSGNPLAMVAGLTTLQKLARENVFDNLNSNTAAFVDSLRKRLEELSYRVVSIGSIFWIVGQNEIPLSPAEIEASAVARFNKSHSQLLEQGIYFPPSAYEVCFISTAHTPEVLSQAADRIVDVLTFNAKEDMK
jgi:glutamate-1-semialdehyde 2,1-aminomutase